MKANYKVKKDTEQDIPNGQIVRKEDGLYVYKDGEYYPIEDQKIDTGMSLYELNKQGYAQLLPYDETQIQDAIAWINEFSDKNKGKYYMLLCKEISYYTVFEKDFLTYDCLSLGHGVIECLDNVGTIHGIDDNGEGALEIWVKTSDEEVYCMLLFNYDVGVVKVGA